jgi:PEP-CTERM motif
MRIAVFLVMSLLAASPAAAAPTINFDQGGGAGQAGGSLSYDGEGGALVGTNIGFGALSGIDTPANAGTSLFCVPNCTLTFETGLNVVEAQPIGDGTIKLWTWAGDGSFEVDGTLNTLADGTGTEVATGTLLSGEFTGTVAGLVGPDGRLLVAGIGNDEKIGGLLQFYGLPDFLPFRFAQTEIVATGLAIGANNSLDGSVTNADLTNTQAPEPGTLFLLGTGGAGLMAMWRRKQRR